MIVGAALGDQQLALVKNQGGGNINRFQRAEGIFANRARNRIQGLTACPRARLVRWDKIQKESH